MKISLLQSNPIIGDLEGNAKRIKMQMQVAQVQKPDLIVTSELALMGYPPRDLLLYPSFIKQAWRTLRELAESTRTLPPILVGAVVANKNIQGRPLFNAAVLLQNGEIQKVFYKSLLPTYDVFDEDRYFEPVHKPQVLTIQGEKIGISICEDLWNDKDFWQKPRYHFDPIKKLAQEKVDFIINLSASPFSVNKQRLRESMISASARKYHLPILYINQVGGNDDLIFDGASVSFNKKGELIARAKAFEEDILIIDPLGPDLINNLRKGRTVNKYPVGSEVVFKALILGVRDYFKKCAFTKALIGLSGGIDSAVTTVIATYALGPKNVTAVLMPSPYTSPSSITDATKLANVLGITTMTIDIRSLMEDFNDSLQEAFKGFEKDVTEENIQSRIRGNLLMALSNKYKALVLSTGNKSELTVGYTTIYGDLSGGMAVIGDLLKTEVYRLAKWINRSGKIIPESIIQKAPSAELRPNQKDQDSLPPYEILDKIIYFHIEEQLGKDEIVKKGYNARLVENVLTLIRKAEYKRRQAPPALKVTPRAFGAGWRMPIAASG